MRAVKTGDNKYSMACSTFKAGQFSFNLQNSDAIIAEGEDGLTILRAFVLRAEKDCPLWASLGEGTGITIDSASIATREDFEACNKKKEAKKTGEETSKKEETNKKEEEPLDLSVVGFLELYEEEKDANISFKYVLRDDCCNALFQFNYVDGETQKQLVKALLASCCMSLSPEEKEFEIELQKGGSTMAIVSVKKDHNPTEKPPASPTLRDFIDAFQRRNVNYVICSLDHKPLSTFATPATKENKEKIVAYLSSAYRVSLDPSHRFLIKNGDYTLVEIGVSAI